MSRRVYRRVRARVRDRVPRRDVMGADFGVSRCQGESARAQFEFEFELCCGSLFPIAALFWGVVCLD